MVQCRWRGRLLNGAGLRMQDVALTLAKLIWTTKIQNPHALHAVRASGCVRGVRQGGGGTTATSGSRQAKEAGARLRYVQFGTFYETSLIEHGSQG